MIDQNSSTALFEDEARLIEKLNTELAEYDLFSLKDKPLFEIQAAGLQFFHLLPDCKSTSLFVLDPDDFSFKCKLVVPYLGEEDENNKFLLLSENGVIAQALNDFSIHFSPLPNCCEEIAILPLVSHIGIVGVILLTKSKLHYSPSLCAVLKVFANQFALLLQSSLLHREVTNLKENVEQIVTLRTLDATQDTREVKQILNSVQTGILLIDKSNDLIIDVNTMAAEIIGTERNDLVGKASFDFFFKSGRGTQGGITTNQEGLLRKKNGAFIPIIRTVADIISEGKELLIISFIDITERKKMENELQQIRADLEARVEERTTDLKALNSKLQSEIERRTQAEEDLLKFYWAVQQNPVMIILTDAAGVVEYVNPKFLETTSYEFTEVVGNNFSMINASIPFGPDAFFHEFTSISDQMATGEYQCKKKDGSLFWVITLVSPIINLEGDITNYVIVQEDVTLKKEAQEQIIIAKEKAEESDRLKSTIFANMSHELRTPLIGILGFSQILQDEVEDPFLGDMAEKIRLSGNRLLLTLNTILFLSQIEHSDIINNQSKINVCEVAKLTALKFTDRVQAKHLTYSVEIPEADWEISATEEFISTAIEHLLDNAQKFTKEGFVRITIEKQLSESGNAVVRIIIADSGIGISETGLANIFEPFRQDSEGFGRSFEGSGLGLTLVKKIVTMMQGTISVQSTLNKGTVFMIDIPMA